MSVVFFPALAASTGVSEKTSPTPLSSVGTGLAAVRRNEHAKAHLETDDRGRVDRPTPVSDPVVHRWPQAPSRKRTRAVRPAVADPELVRYRIGGASGPFREPTRARPC
ncbi:hypothetical protein GCM10017557_00010 [Streptomyces aurantiacus]|uniref:Uncharacterized protein n=1 Tax=Streptomyces aurantiacus TaxID=47760 RepID=A0A7G1NRK6_9ACTN|nr:hypothetical protein GCM10017557_00010 [Streptomyces aurantiacus]